MTIKRMPAFKIWEYSLEQKSLLDNFVAKFAPKLPLKLLK